MSRQAANPLFSSIIPFLFGMLIALAVFVGLRLRDYHLLTAESGMGYYLGIIGCVFVGILILYPLRKRFRALQAIGSVKTWFRIHMLSGSLAPICILYHCNFNLGALNSNVALISMLIVAGSGVAGRYFYSKIHRGLYGQKEDFGKIKEEMVRSAAQMQEHWPFLETGRQDLLAFAEDVLKPQNNLVTSISHAMSINRAASRLKKTLKRQLQQELTKRSGASGADPQKNIELKTTFIREVRQFVRRAVHVAEFGCYERLFSLWHVLHIPLFFLMVIAAIVHIIAVHQY
ncbi:MAG: pyridine nucleotide-disulfide oxidoreductase [Alphaproteobacteria bacterium]|nr:pyridine nucleotide-disulfide oxidoreductase [Alphaproteobacteria bacterium]